MKPAAKHLDPVIGIDLHIVQPPGCPPVPVPHPFVGMVFDPADYLPGGLGATVLVNGLPRATAGTRCLAISPHIPLGGVFVKPPANEGEVFMGSATVIADGEPLAFAGSPVNTCQDVGVPPPVRMKKRSALRSLVAPTTTVLPIPTSAPVLIGGPPVPSMNLLGTQAAMAGLGGALKKLRRLQRASPKLKAVSDRIHRVGEKACNRLKIGPQARNRVHRGICTVTGHPVDVATGKVFTDFTDLELPGPIPFKLERVWYSTDSEVAGPLGHGWHHSFDVKLLLTDSDAVVKLPDGRGAAFPRLDLGGLKECFNPKERLTLRWEKDKGYSLETADRLTYRFRPVKGRGGLQVLESITDPAGHQIQLFYSSAGLLVGILDSAGRRIDFHLDSAGRITAISVPHPDESHCRLTWRTFGYDYRGNLVEVRDALNHFWRFEYQGHLLVKETNRNGLSFHFEWQGTGPEARCIHTWGDGGIYDHRIDYDELWPKTTVTNSLGQKTIYHHDGAVVTKVIDARGGVTQTEYDRHHRVVLETDPLGGRRLNSYDERGNLLRTIGPDGAVVKAEYDSLDLPLRLIDPVGGEWSWTRDEKGRVTEREDPLGRKMRFYYRDERLSGITDPAGGYTSLSYDSAGNLERVITPDEAETRFESDALGRLVLTKDPQGNVERRWYDVLGRPVRIHEPDGNLRQLSYDPEGNLVHGKDRHREVELSYSGMNRLATRREAGTTVRFEYDTEEDLTAITNEHGRVYRFMLGPTGEVEEEHGFDGFLRRYTRDLAGRVTRVDRPGDRWTTYEYDRGGRPLSVKHSDGSSESYVYRPDGELLLATSASGFVKFERDLLGRVLMEGQGGHWVRSEYDALGNRTRVLSSMGADLRIDRNKMGDVTGLTEEKSQYEAGFQRDELGFELERSLPGGLKSRWQRDSLGRPLEHTVTAKDSFLRAVGYRWEPNDRLKMVIDALKGPTEYGHDERGFLVSAQQPDGILELRLPDAVGNLFRSQGQVDRQYGPAGQLLASSSPQGITRYSYDPEGNLIEKIEPSGRSWRYEWNGSGMMAKVIRPDGTVVRFEYDALGRRTKKHFRGQTTHFVWDGNHPLHEWVEGQLEPLAPATPVPIWTADSVVKRREAELSKHLAQGPPVRGSRESPITWLFEPETFSPMAKLVGDERYSIVTDHLGTPVLMTDAEGHPQWSARISTFGQLKDIKGDRYACPFRWPGQYEDAETGFYYNRFRFYDPEAGQYVSQDPIGLAGGLATYAYVGDPWTWSDPFGLQGCSKGRVPDDAFVVRGGVATPEQIARGIGPHRDVPGLTGFSAQSRAGASVEELTSTGGVGNGPFPHGQVSVTTAGKLRSIGCEVVPSPGGGANHVTVSPGSASPAQISQQFTPRPNPARSK